MTSVCRLSVLHRLAEEPSQRGSTGEYSVPCPPPRPPPSSLLPPPSQFPSQSCPTHVMQVEVSFTSPAAPPLFVQLHQHTCSGPSADPGPSCTALSLGFRQVSPVLGCRWQKSLPRAAFSFLLAPDFPTASVISLQMSKPPLVQGHTGNSIKSFPMVPGQAAPSHFLKKKKKLIKVQISSQANAHCLES